MCDELEFLAAGCISKEKEVLDGYLEDYEGLCSKKQVSFCFLTELLFVFFLLP